MASSGQILALTAFVLVQVPVAQDPGAQRREPVTGMIVGQVVDGDSGRPLRGAVVVLGGPSASGGAAHPRILTGNDGRFVYRGLRRGAYNIYAYKPGYTEGAHGRRRPAGPPVPLSLAEGQRTDEAVVRMWKHAAISGTVVDEAGERLIGVRVQAYRRTVISGRRRFVPSGTGSTDDRGIYRVGGLIPGDYIVGAVARQVPMVARFETGISISATRRDPDAQSRGRDAAVLPLRDPASVLGQGAAIPPPARDGRLFVYPPIFHPNAPTGDAASMISLRAGTEHLGADLQLAPVPTVSISGFVAGPDGPIIRTALRLVASNTSEITLDADAITAMTDRAGRFTFPAVPSGHYSLRLVRGAPSRAQGAVNTLVWTDLPVSVGMEDIENLMVQAQPGIRIGGRVEFEGESQRPPAGRAVTVSIEPADPVFTAVDGSLTIRVDAYGEFRSAPLPGGRYYVRIPNSPGGWMFKSATSEGRDVVDTPVNADADLLDVVVTFTDRWSGLTGFVQNRQGPDPAASVLVFPTDSDTWASSGSNPRRVRSIRTGRTGEYSVNLPPGDYYVIAVPEAQTDDWQDPAFLDAASRAAIRVSIAEGERRSLDLRTQEVR